MYKNINKYFPIFVLPTLISFFLVFFIPFVLGVFLSFTEFTTVENAVWVGFQNYIKAFTKDNNFLNALWFTIKFTVVSVVSVNILSFSLALILTKAIKGTSFFRTVFFMPNLIGGIVLGYIWNLLINSVLFIFSQSSLIVTIYPLYQITLYNISTKITIFYHKKKPSYSKKFHKK